MKKVVSIVVILILIISVTVPVFAEEQGEYIGLPPYGQFPELDAMGEYYYIVVKTSGVDFRYFCTEEIPTYDIWDNQGTPMVRLNVSGGYNCNFYRNSYTKQWTNFSGGSGAWGVSFPEVNEVVASNYDSIIYQTPKNVTNVSVNNTVFDNLSNAGITFDYDGFLGKLGIKLYVNKNSIGNIVSTGGGGVSGGAGSSGSYGEPIQEWEYEEPTGTVNIESKDIAYYNNAEYKLEILNGDVVTNTYYYYTVVDAKTPYVDINYPVNGINYDYFPNINIRYYDMGELYIYINDSLYKRIQTSDKEGIEVIDGTNGLFDIGLNTVSVKDANSQTVSTVQYMIMREGSDPNVNLPEYDAESWVQDLFNRIMDEYSLFFVYVKAMYSWLPLEILGLVAISIMLAVVLWFTGRK